MAMCLLNSSLQFTVLHRTEVQFFAVLMLIFPQPPTSEFSLTTTSAYISKILASQLVSKQPPKMALQEFTIACSQSQKQSSMSWSMKPIESTINTCPCFTIEGYLMRSSAQIFRAIDGGDAQVVGVVSERGNSEQKLLQKHSMQVSCLFLMYPSRDLPNFLERLRKCAQFSRKEMKVTGLSRESSLSIHPTTIKSECWYWFSSMRMNLEFQSYYLCSLHWADSAYNIDIAIISFITTNKQKSFTIRQ